jgi:hypothetical protein
LIDYETRKKNNISVGIYSNKNIMYKVKFSQRRKRMRKIKRRIRERNNKIKQFCRHASQEKIY